MVVIYSKKDDCTHFEVKNVRMDKVLMTFTVPRGEKDKKIEGGDIRHVHLDDYEEHKYEVLGYLIAYTKGLNFTKPRDRFLGNMIRIVIGEKLYVPKLPVDDDFVTAIVHATLELEKDLKKGMRIQIKRANKAL